MVIKLSVLTQSAVHKKVTRVVPVMELEVVERIELIEELEEEIISEKVGLWDSIKSWLIRIKDKLFPRLSILVKNYRQMKRDRHAD